MAKKKVKMPDYSIPCFNYLVRMYGLTTAAIYGTIFLYEQGRDKKCWASQERIAGDLGLNRKTVRKHLKETLIEEKWIEEVDKKWGKRTFAYRTTSKLRDRVDTLNRAIATVNECAAQHESEGNMEEDRLHDATHPPTYMGHFVSEVGTSAREMGTSGDCATLFL